jgi:predicted Rdx family selenoprotein
MRPHVVKSLEVRLEIFLAIGIAPEAGGLRRESCESELVTQHNEEGQFSKADHLDTNL